MRDMFFEVKNCQRCGSELFARIMSWFTDSTICIDCSTKEDELKSELRARGVDVSKLEGCGYLPKVEEFKNG
jgi:superfamily II helicase